MLGVANFEVYSSDHVMTETAGRLSSVGRSFRPRDYWKGLFGSSKWIDGQEKLGTQIIESPEMKRERECVWVRGVARLRGA